MAHSGDEPPEPPERAIKYTYDFENDKWDREKVFVQFAQQPFAAGGMRVCYKMTEVEVSSSGQIITKSDVLVAKMFMKKVRPEVYFDEAMTQMLAESYAQEFNKWPLKRKISFLPVNVYQLRERGGQLVNVEPMLQGKYVKHNDNDGNVETDDELPQAFSHFSWEASDHQLLIVDIQGVGDFYTDPQVHSFDGESFGQGNLGMEGVNNFLKSHTCNTLCRTLNLPCYAQGRLCEDLAKGTSEALKGKMARLNINDENRSRSPLRWQSGQEYQKGISRAIGSMDDDDGRGAPMANQRQRPQSGETMRVRPQSGLDDSPSNPSPNGPGGARPNRARPQSGLPEEAPTPKARMRPESEPMDYPDPDNGRKGGARDAGDSYNWTEYRAPSGGQERRRREASPDGPLIRQQAAGAGVRRPPDDADSRVGRPEQAQGTAKARQSVSPVARVRIPAAGYDGGGADGDRPTSRPEAVQGSARARQSVSPVARVRVPGYDQGDSGAGSSSRGGGLGGGSMRPGGSGASESPKGRQSVSPAGRTRAMEAEAENEVKGLPAPQKFVTGRRASVASSAVDGPGGDSPMSTVRLGRRTDSTNMDAVQMDGSSGRRGSVSPVARVRGPAGGYDQYDRGGGGYDQYDRGAAPAPPPQKMVSARGDRQSVSPSGRARVMPEAEEDMTSWPAPEGKFVSSRRANLNADRRRGVVDY